MGGRGVASPKGGGAYQENLVKAAFGPKYWNRRLNFGDLKVADLQISMIFGGQNMK